MLTYKPKHFACQTFLKETYPPSRIFLRTLKKLESPKVSNYFIGHMR